MKSVMKLRAENKSEAAKWYSKAASQGHSKSQKALEELGYTW